MLQVNLVMVPLAQASGQEPQLKPQELVPQLRPSTEQEVASQPEQVPLSQVAEAELTVQSKQSLPAWPQAVASLVPGTHWLFLMQPRQHWPFRQTPADAPTMQPSWLASGVRLQVAWQALPSTVSSVQGS